MFTALNMPFFIARGRGLLYCGENMSIHANKEGKKDE